MQENTSLDLETWRNNDDAIKWVCCCIQVVCNAQNTATLKQYDRKLLRDSIVSMCFSECAHINWWSDGGDKVNKDYGWRFYEYFEILNFKVLWEV